MNKIKTIIVDDEPLARDNIHILLQKDLEIEIIGECRNGAKAVEALNNLEVDLLMLDIQMPEMNGFEVLSEIDPVKIPIIIFITAYDKFAIQAFKVHAVDYLLKPFSDDEFFKSLKNAKEYFRLKNIDKFGNKLNELLENYFDLKVASTVNKISEPSKPRYLNRFSIIASGKTFIIKADEVDWIEAADYYVQLHEGKKKHLLRDSMNNLELKLDPEKFIRIHRSSIVNIDKIRAIESYFGGEYLVILKDDTKLKLSRYRKKRLKAFFNMP
ncbi:MAG: LytTR family DNA-binding domain-containing protein [Ignavibacteriales bacterium]|nr:LytTR family DNA-binding domain-containing protein [Ignavibacteriales bacterium]